MIKIFLDSNILFSIVYSDKNTKLSDLFLLQELKKVEIYISNLVKLETTKNVETKIPEKSDKLNDLLSKVEIFDDVLIKYSDIQNLPINDRIILSTAIYNKIEYFITGNSNDFRELYFKNIGKTTVLKPADFYEILVSK